MMSAFTPRAEMIGENSVTPEQRGAFVVTMYSHKNGGSAGLLLPRAFGKPPLDH